MKEEYLEGLLELYAKFDVDGNHAVDFGEEFESLWAFLGGEMPFTTPVSAMAVSHEGVGRRGGGADER
eukprot:COSAG01_NODE_2796_length_7058_cov_12.294295_8_plen_68_part_00